MKLLILVSRFPYPLEKGDKLRAFHQIRELSQIHELYVFCLSDEKVSESAKKEVEQYCTELHIFQLNKLLIYWNTAKQLFTDKPYQVGYFYQSRIQQKINREINRIQPNHIYCQLIRTSDYVKNFHGIKKTIDYMDALGMGMKRRAEIASGLKKQLFATESKRLSEYEHRIFDYFDGHTIISEQDKGHIGHPQNSEIVVIENGISDDFFDFEKEIEQDHDIVFNGNMNYPPNIECAEYLVNEILPELQKTKPEVKVLLSGANPNERVSKLNQNPAVTVTGWVDDIRESYRRGKIFVAPLFIGTGLQNKLLEAMALGLPSITTPLANNALKAPEGDSILIAQEKAGFVEHIHYLLDHPDQAQQIALNGQKFVRSHYNWKDTVERLNQLLTPKTGKMN
ncbi:MAG: glycosyltransferase [Flavobacteriales bacterium]|nr:glycosyltransferase [Flavobacteriales bacterium]